MEQKFYHNLYIFKYIENVSLYRYCNKENLKSRIGTTVEDFMTMVLT